MRAAGAVAWSVVAAGVAIGTVGDRIPQRAPLEFGGYRVLAGDFHTHPAPLSGSLVGPWETAIEARRQGLDVIAITPHNGALAGRVGRWFAERFGGPIVIPGEELHGPRYHLIALGAPYLSWRLPAREAIDAVHRAGGVAIAAHPIVESWASFDAETARLLDGAEVLQPIVFLHPDRGPELREFWSRSGAAAIGSSDWHGVGPLGLCRTYVFAREASANGVMEAIRARRTVAFDGTRAYGHPEFVPFVTENASMPQRPSAFGGACVAAGLAALILFRR